ncbi:MULTISPECIES: metal-dependent transcriptional regulator [Eubacteriales]|uniref:Iron (Metal) dependent repressor, DtxR family n=1 Tax=Bittarella massiliensis (ex Durand et al. 2017) TaxID=1720313 RepID=A0AAQ1RVY4_9FIRM|nr:iron dependent repressor, DNA binding domain protein [Clostridium sp. ATCC 29733]MZL69099.1 metal-dependent transcriptional regulator [Bittarella massiliensis (ex Durand et al. 2017)]MZL79895.1 metal-dependent transcriptional regulator [Bittarella massiliensis (ex Durand et al. 2017)]SHG12072.1 iron (metal) dependent repressor, DtxR family [Bittarella massiliensis (ex Durand et al. 2017)]
MKLQESGENYLETILLLRQRQGHVRSIDVATELGFSKPSISRAIGILKSAGYVQVGEGGNILLTESGQQKAEAVYERHRLISRYLVLTLGVPAEIADADACRIEHIISQESFDQIKAFVARQDGEGH